MRVLSKSESLSYLNQWDLDMSSSGLIEPVVFINWGPFLVAFFFIQVKKTFITLL